MSKKTPLYDWHVTHGAKMVEFGGFLMPVSYQGVLAEHAAVRENCGLFDISHMGEVFFTGSDAKGCAQSLTSNDVDTLQDGEAQYSLLMNPEGYALDDLLVYRLKDDEFFFCVNAANTEKDFAWIQAQATGQVQVINRSDEMGMLALQGPRSPEVLKALGYDLLAQPRFSVRPWEFHGTPLLVSRTGYTGEEGAEFFLPNALVEPLWGQLLEAGQPAGICPVGLGARDTLRLEMGYVLYGHELNETIDPLEAGLSWIIKLENGDFAGREALLSRKAKGVARRLVGLTMQDPGIPREGMTVFKDGQAVGKVLSGTMSPTLKQGIATALLEKTASSEPGEISVDIRGKLKKATLTQLPFVKKK